MPNTKRVFYFDVLRVAATVAVIILHICARPWEALTAENASWAFFNVLDSAVRWAVPIFVMLSGALFLDPAKEVSFSSIWRKNILRIAAAFGFWSALYAVVDLWKGMPLSDLPLALLKGEYHMWFLFLIAGLYLFVPLLRMITCSKKNTELFLCVGGVLFFLIPRTVHLLSVFKISVPFQELILRAMNINVVSVCYLFVFVLGHYLHRYDLPRTVRGILYGLGVLGFAATAGLTHWHTLQCSAPSGAFFTYMSFNVMAMAAAVFVFAKYHWNKERKWIAELSRYSFGMYLSHVKFIDLLAPMGITLWTVLPITVAVAALSLGVSFVLHRIPKLKNYIV